MILQHARSAPAVRALYLHTAAPRLWREMDKSPSLETRRDRHKKVLRNRHSILAAKRITATSKSPVETGLLSLIKQRSETDLYTRRNSGNDIVVEIVIGSLPISQAIQYNGTGRTTGHQTKNPGKAEFDIFRR